MLPPVLPPPARPDLTLCLRRRVRVVADRPLGSVHPRWPNLVYGVNYGELPGTTSGDGRPIDASLLGWDEPVQEAEGTVIAVLLHADDVEDKLVVARDGTVWRDEEIMGAVAFQEQFFDSRLVR